MDLCGPSAVESIGKKKYILVIVDDYSRFTWVLFLRNKSYAAEEIINFIKKMEVMLNKKVRTVHSDNGSEFKNQTLDGFLKTKGISHNFSAPYTPQQNGVIERRNRSLCEAARTMLNFANFPMYFWAEAISTACFTQNRFYTHKRFHITPYEVFYLELERSFDKIQRQIRRRDFLGYSQDSKAVDSEARAPDNHVSELSKLTDGPDDSSTSSVQRPSSVEGEPSNQSEGNVSVEGEPNNSPTSHPQEISHIMSLYPSVQGEPEISTPNSATPVALDRATTSSTPAAVEGENTLNSTSHIHTPQTNATNSNNHLIMGDFPSTSGYPSDIEDIDSEGPRDFNPNYPPLEKWTRNHPPSLVIDNVQDRVLSRAQLHQR
ncbi:hypothetical protein L1887_11843 [Cichorium endivia]|nr:hypothetical protein L1887_11843 [Cichorium endivia]